MVEKLNFKKYGFIRNKEEDFSDDGNRFKCYDYKGLRISYLKDPDYGYFLSFHNPRGQYYDVAEFFPEVLESYRKISDCSDDYNGVNNMTNEDLEQWSRDIDECLNECDELDKLIEALKNTSAVNIYSFNDLYFVNSYEYNSNTNQIKCKWETIDKNNWRLRNCKNLGFKINEIVLTPGEVKELVLN